MAIIAVNCRLRYFVLFSPFMEMSPVALNKFTSNVHDVSYRQNTCGTNNKQFSALWTLRVQTCSRHRKLFTKSQCLAFNICVTLIDV